MLTKLQENSRAWPISLPPYVCVISFIFFFNGFVPLDQKLDKFVSTFEADNPSTSLLILDIPLQFWLAPIQILNSIYLPVQCLGHFSYN